MVPVAGHQKTAPGTDQEVPWSGHFSPWKYLEIYRGGYFHSISMVKVGDFPRLIHL